MKALERAHVGWPEIAYLARRLAILDAAVTGASDLSRDLADAGFRVAVEGALKLAGEPLEVEKNQARLDEFFRRTYTALESLQPSAKLIPVVVPFRSRLDSDLKAGLCQKCNPAAPCRGTRESAISDDAVVRQTGQCISPLKELFSFALSLASQAYSGVKTPTVHFRTGNLGDLSHGFMGMSLRAETRDLIPSLRPRTERVVLLEIDSGLYNINDFLATLYVLFHECFCHLFSGIAVTSEEATLSDAFSEGWMDFVGTGYLLNALRAPALPERWRQAIREFQASARELCSGRVNCRVQVPSANSVRYLPGRLAAERLLALFAALTGSDREAFGLLLRFSTQVSASLMTDGFRGEIVSATLTVLPDFVVPTLAGGRVPREVLKEAQRFMVRSDHLALAHKIIDVSKTYN